jgi:hypothetical protein
MSFIRLLLIGNRWRVEHLLEPVLVVRAIALVVESLQSEIERVRHPLDADVAMAKEMRVINLTHKLFSLHSVRRFLFWFIDPSHSA